MDTAMSFATLRLGKTSVDDIQMINDLSGGALNPLVMISVVCTQVPAELVEGTYVFIWLGSDNSKGLATAWKQGFKAVGRVTDVQRGEKYNDESTTTVAISYIFPSAVNRLELLRDAPTAYYWCSSMPVIGIDDHSNQTIRMINGDTKRSQLKALFYAINQVADSFHAGITKVYPELESFFDYSPRNPQGTIDEDHTEGQGGDIELTAAIGTYCSNAENVLLYGVPGAGKSWTIQNEYCDDENYIERLVFHPDYTYSDFVGQILPASENNSIRYRFTPGPFTRLLKRATEDPFHHYYLIIEEINRGNAPAIFGDIFQLLDRSEVELPGIGLAGVSQYGITNADIATKVYDDPEHFVRIPANMTILATMNTADQNVFTLDTAFQRRWHMRMIENSFDNHPFADKPILDTGISWKNFCLAINQEILLKSAGMTSSEDKRLGAYFVSADDLIRDPQEDNENADHRSRMVARRHNSLFAEKVIKYLWDDAFKYYRSDIFEISNYNSLEAIIKQFMQNTGAERLLIFKEEIRNRISNPVQ